MDGRTDERTKKARCIRGGALAPSTWTVTQLSSWYAFLHDTKVKGVSKDTWSMLLEFLKTVDPQFTAYDEEGTPRSTICHLRNPDNLQLPGLRLSTTMSPGRASTCKVQM